MKKSIWLRAATWLVEKLFRNPPRTIYPKRRKRAVKEDLRWPNNHKISCSIYQCLDGVDRGCNCGFALSEPNTKRVTP